MSLTLQLPLSFILYGINKVHLSFFCCCCAQNIIPLLPTPSHPCTHSHTLRHQRTSHIVFDFAISCLQLLMGGRGDRSLTSRALLDVIGVQEGVEAAGYNWKATRTVWMVFKASLHFSPAISITPLVHCSSPPSL